MPSRLIRRSRPFIATKVSLSWWIWAVPWCWNGSRVSTRRAADKVHLCEAPLVEGAIAAAVEAAIGSDIKQVLARGADSKSSALGIVSNTSSVVSSNEQRTKTKDNRQKKPTDCSQSFRITRPSSGSIRYDSNPISVPNQVRNLTRDTEPARAESINQVATLGAPGTRTGYHSSRLWCGWGAGCICISRS